jgi:hypothetical protein
MWKRQEIQKVSRRYSLGLWLALLCTAVQASAAVLPDAFGSFKRVGRGSVQIADRPVWDEYGFRTAELGEYSGAGRTVSVSVWQLKDTTGAWAATQWLQPGVTQHGNYVLRVEGDVAEPDFADLKAKLPKVDRAANPNLPQFFSEQARVKDSGRYLLGPVSLAKFEPRVPADLVGFDKGAEGQLATYKTEGGEAKLLLFSYPTPQIAGERFRELQKRQEWKARRHGPMVAVVLDAAPEAADKLLASVSYRPKVSWSEHVPKNENPGEMILAICILAGGLIAASVAFGLLFGGLRQVFGSKFGVQAIDDNFTSLHLGDRT